MSELVILRLVVSTVLLLVALAGHGALAFRPLALQNSNVRSTEGGFGRKREVKKRLVAGGLAKTRLMNN